MCLIISHLICISYDNHHCYRYSRIFTSLYFKSPLETISRVLNFKLNDLLSSRATNNVTHCFLHLIIPCYFPFIFLPIKSSSLSQEPQILTRFSGSTDGTVFQVRLIPSQGGRRWALLRGSWWDLSKALGVEHTPAWAWPMEGRTVRSAAGHLSCKWTSQ